MSLVHNVSRHTDSLAAEARALRISAFAFDSGAAIRFAGAIRRAYAADSRYDAATACLALRAELSEYVGAWDIYERAGVLAGRFGG